MPPEPCSVFVSYRREDSLGHAGRIRDALVRRFGQEQVFYDLSSVKRGALFEQVIREKLKAATIVLAVIGPRWSSGRRLRSLLGRRDWIVIELALARELGKPVLPVLVGGTPPSGLGSLPESIAYLSQINQFSLRDESWEEDFDRLVELLPTVQPTSGISSDSAARANRWRQMASAAALAAIVGLVWWWWPDRGPCDPPNRLYSAILGSKQPDVAVFQSKNYRYMYLMHEGEGTSGRLSEVKTDADRRNATWHLTSGLAAEQAVSLEPCNSPGSFLRNAEFRLRLSEREEDQDYRAGATFKVVPGLADPDGVSFQSVQYPDRFVRHYSYGLQLDREDASDTAFRDDATFYKLPPPWGN
jgi:hypothetical protein